MTYNTQDGFHIGTLTSCILLAVNWSAFGAMIIPYSPFLIRIYLPNVFPLILLHSRSRMKTLERMWVC